MSWIVIKTVIGNNCMHSMPQNIAKMPNVLNLFVLNHRLVIHSEKETLKDPETFQTDF